MKRIILFISILLSAIAVSAQTQVTEFIPGATANGVNYALPRTSFKADVYAVKLSHHPGEFAKYAKRLLHIDDVCMEEATTCSVQSINFRTEGEPDTLKYFTVKLKDKSTAPFVQLSKSGMLLAINTNVDEQSFTLPAVRQSAPQVNGKQYLTEDILMATSTAKMAELTAAEIMAIRESKNEIRRGQAESMPKDGASMKIVLDELNRQEDALTRLFTGTVDTTYMAKTYSFTPYTDVADSVFFRFSSKLGFVDADDLSGEPYYISIADKHTVQLPTAKEAAKRKIEGIVYNMPSIALVTVRTLRSNVYQQDVPFAQFGTIDMLAPALFNKGVSTKVTFNPSTGGLMKLDQ